MDFSSMYFTRQCTFLSKYKSTKYMNLALFYPRSIVESKACSRVNVVMRLPTEDLEKKFVTEAGEQGFMHVKGHRYKFS